MSPQLRSVFPYFAVGVLLTALAWAMSFGTLPPADFTFDNGNEVETIDPSLATGQPEHRVINAIFEGLLRHEPPANWRELDGPNRNVPLEPRPGLAELPEISADGRTYTFRIRPVARWSDGSSVVADDFAWSWRRMLHPETGAKYASLLYYVTGAENYNLARVAVGDPVEVELPDRPQALQPFPRGTIVRGKLLAIHQPPAPQLPANATDDERGDAEADWKRRWVYAVETAEGGRRCFAKNPSGVTLTALAPPLAESAASPGAEPRLEACLHVLPDFERTVGVQARDPATLVVTLSSRTPYFSDLVAFYPLYPVNRRCLERHGSPNWTKPENIVTSGAFRLQLRRIRDRIRVVKNERYWDAANVHLNVIDILAAKSETTALNMYLNGQIDWATVMPISTVQKLKRLYPDHFRGGPELTIYFYRLNVTRPELRDARVRRALALAIDKQQICDRVTRAGELAASGVVPPGLAGYTSPPGAAFDVAAARRLLADAGYPGGRGLPPIEILYNDLDIHRTVAETIQQMWKEHLGVDAVLRGLEWGVYLDSTHKLDYDVSRGGWIADYADPNTFLDMFMSHNENNQTGWSSARYDELLRAAAGEADPARRMQLLHDAEAILIEEQPVIPIYFRVSKNLVQPHIDGFFNTVQDEHPLRLLRVARQ